jgi:hypothetical protein
VRFEDLKKKIYIYILLTTIGLMLGGSVYKDHTFNKETTHRTNFHSTIQEHEHPQYSAVVQ